MRPGALQYPDPQDYGLSHKYGYMRQPKLCIPCFVQVVGGYLGYVGYFCLAAGIALACDVEVRVPPRRT